MPTVTVGNTAIPYRVRHSLRAKRLRLVVTPGQVEVVAPANTRDARIQAFVGSKRRWLYDKTEALRKNPLGAMPQRFVTGAKVLFRGRLLKLRIEPADGDEASLRYATGFRALVPGNLAGEERERVARDLVVSWLSNRALEDARAFIGRYGPKLGAHPTAVRIRGQKTLWGSCSTRGVISLNWRLMAAPRPIYEYVVVHELCHLRERNHGARFWRLVGTLLPDYRERRAWLRKHGLALG